MLTPRSRILWGTGLENPLDFAWAWDSVAPRRKRRAGSERRAIPGAGYDTWKTGRDFTMPGVMRYIEAADGSDPIGVGSGWESPIGVEAFLEWAGDGNQFTFVPDVVSAPDFTVPSCWLEEPYDPDPTPETDGSLSQAISIANATVPFGQAMRGIMFEYTPGMSLTDPIAATFARASAATRRGLPSTSMAAAIGASDLANVLRDRHYEDTLRTALLEAARTQLVTDPENFGNWTIWAGSPGRTSGQADPFGGTAAYLVTDDDAAGAEGWTEVVTFTADGTKCASIFVRAGTAAATSLGIFDSTASAWRHELTVTWTAGVPSIVTALGGGTRYPVENWGGGWYRLSFSVNSVVAANTNRWIVYGATDVNSTTGTTFFFGANAWNATCPSSYQGPSLTTRNADLCTWQNLYKPQAMFTLVDFVERGSVLQAGINARLHYLGTGDFVNGSVLSNINSGSGRYQAFHLTTGGVSLFSEPAHAALALGDRIQFLHNLLSDGSVRGRIAINGAADVVGALSAAGLLPAAWSGTTFAINSSAAGGSAGLNAYARVKVGALAFAGITRDTIAKALAA